MDVGEVFPAIVEGLEDVAQLGDGVAVLQAIEPPPFSEWLDRSVDLFFVVLSWVLTVPLLRFLAVFAVFWIAFNVLVYLLRTGRSLAH